MNEKGFTLMELLAVIIILAAIALIATPVILNVINSTKAQADYRAIEGYAKAVEYGGMKYVYDHGGGQPADFAAFSSLVEYKGATISCASVSYADGHVTLTNCTINGGGKAYDYSNSKVTEHS